MATIKLKYLSSDVDANGNARYYVRKPGEKKIRLRKPFGSPEFIAEYNDAMTGKIKPKQHGLPKLSTESLEWLVREFYKSTNFRSKLNPESQKMRRRILDKIVDKHGEKRFATITSAQIAAGMDERADRPEAANNYLKTLRGLFKFAKKRNLIKVNPTIEVEKIRVKTDGFHSWTREEVEQYERRHPIGSKARLAFALLLYTGQRRGDVIRMGRQHIEGDVLRVRQGKTAETVYLPILPELAKVIAASSVGHLAFLVTEYGKPFAAAGFGNWFRERCNEAGLPHCSAHGLRKAGATIAAENGASDRQLMAIFGWRKAEQATLYTRAAEKKKLARDAMPLIVPNRSETK